MEAMSFADSVLRLRAACGKSENDIIGDVIHPSDRMADFLGKDTYQTYHAIGEFCKPESIVEIGTRFGYSMQSLIRGSGRVKRFYSYDAEFDTAGSHEYIRNRFSSLAATLSQVRVNTQQIHSLRVPEHVNLVHVDGDHSIQGVYHDCVLAMECLKDGGWLVIDDIISCPGRVKVAADRWCAEFGQTPHFIPCFQGMCLIQFDKQTALKNIRAFYQDHDIPVKEYLARTVMPGMTVLDVGGNHGEFAYLLQELVGPSGKVIVFEPCLRDCEYMQRMVLKENAILEQMALGLTHGEANFFIFTEPPHQGLNSLRPPLVNPWGSPVEQTRVKIDTIDNYMAEHRIDKVDLVKLDIEGGEKEFLVGAISLLAMHPVVLFEALDARTRDFGYPAVEIVRHLENKGYTIHISLPGGILEPINYTPGLLSHEQLIAVPK